MKILIEWFGWYGAVAIITAYALVSFSVISSNDILYQILNLTGGLGIVSDAFYKKDYQPGVLNLVWVIIALISIIKIFI